MENPVIGFRAFFSKFTELELEMQLKEARNFFPKSEIVVALCGEKPSKKIANLCTKIFHYNEKPIGLTEPWKILTDYAKSLRKDLIVVDGDSQHIFSEIKKVYEKYEGKVAIPEREKRVIFLSDSEISRVTLEDIENTFLRIKYNCKLKDPQPGLFFINKSILPKLNFKRINNWVGDTALLSQLYEKKIKILSPSVKVRSQTSTALNLDIAFNVISELEKYFGLSFMSIIDTLKKSPEQYLYQGRLAEIEIIKKKYFEFKSRKKINSMKGLILSGGVGTRLRPITHTKQKQLIPIANKPILFYVIEDLVKAGITKIGIITGPNKEQIISSVRNGSIWNVNITYIEQEKPLGLAHAVAISKKFIGDDSFVVYLGDNLLNYNINDFIINFQNSDSDASILLTPVKDPERFGVARLNDKGEVIELIEKPKNPKTNLAIVGVYAFKSSVFEAIQHISPSGRGELEITDAIHWLLKHNYKVKSELVEGWWKDTGTAESLLEANHLILDSKIDSLNNGRIEDGAIVSGRVHIGKGTIVKKGACIRGPAIIGNDCLIGSKVYIGPYTSIGSNVSVLNGEIEYSIILANCKINVNKRISDSLIGENCSIISHNKEPANKANKLVIGDNSNIKL